MRALERSAAPNGYLAWVEVGHVLGGTCKRVNLATAEIGEESINGFTSFPPQIDLTAAIEALWWAHSTTENQVHHVRIGRSAKTPAKRGAGRRPTR